MLLYIQTKLSRAKELDVIYIPIIVVITVHWMAVFLIWGGTAVAILKKQYVWPHFVVIMVTTIIQKVVFGHCPLTTLEQWLLTKCSDCAIYEGSFLVHWFGRFGATELGVDIASYIIFGITVSLAIRDVAERRQVK